MSNNGSEDLFRQDLLLRMDVIVALLLEGLTPENPPSTSAKILRLIALGVSPTQTARLVGKSTNYVSAVVAESKKRTVATRGRRKSSGRP